MAKIKIRANQRNCAEEIISDSVAGATETPPLHRAADVSDSETYRQQFRKATKHTNEAHEQFHRRVLHFLDGWMSMAEVDPRPTTKVCGKNLPRR